MTVLDTIVDALEEQIASAGVMAVDLRNFVPKVDDQSAPERQKIFVEMLRVWIEHRWTAGYPVTAEDGLSQFPGVPFTSDEVELLRFEVQRQASLERASKSQGVGAYRSIDELPSVGQRWGGFELLELLGAGAFAKVYLAKQTGLAGRLVALKLSFRKTQESHWLATLQHSAIVPIYSVEQLDGVYGICMPYLGNTTLADLLRDIPRSTIYPKRSWWRSTIRGTVGSGQRLLRTIQNRQDRIDTVVNSISNAMIVRDGTEDPRVRNEEDRELHEPIAGQMANVTLDNQNSPAAKSLSRCSYVQAICWIGAQLADALAYAHRNGVMHSDIKPANILLASDGQPRLLDFNVSFQSEKDQLITSDFPLGGTLPYMSPEHRRAFEIPTQLDARSDIYSLGVVMYEMLTCRLPRLGDRESNAEDRNPGRWNSAVSPGLSAIVSKCLEFKPENRYATAQQLCDDLNAQFGNLPLVHQAEPSKAERFKKWCILHPRISSSVSIASVAIVCIALLISGLVFRDRAIERADWARRVDKLKQSVPNTISMLSSLALAPEIEPDVVADLERSFGLIATNGGTSEKSTLDPRWVHSIAPVDDELREGWHEILVLVSAQKWNDPPRFLEQLQSHGDSDSSPFSHPIHLVQQRKWRDAAGELNDRLREHPNDYVAWWLLGDCYAYLEEHAHAIQAYTACIAIQPKVAIAYFNRGRSRFLLSEFDAAAEDYRQVNRRSPRWQWARLNRALALQHANRLTEAIVECDAAIEHGYATVSVYRLRSELHAALGDLEKSSQDKLLAIQCTPLTDQHWMDRGLIRLESNPNEALQDFLHALELNPVSVDAHQKIAYVYSELLQQPETSLTYLDALVKLAPSQPTHLAGRAVVYARNGRYEESMVDLAELEKAGIRDGMVSYQIACAYSLLAANSHGTMSEPATSESGRHAFRWYLRAIDADSSFATISLTDPDVQWMRQQSNFRKYTARFKLSRHQRPAVVQHHEQKQIEPANRFVDRAT